MITLLVLAALAVAELAPRIIRLNGRWETPPMEMRRRMRALRLGVVLLALALAVTASAHAQSFDWTLVDDPAVHSPSPVVGWGVFTASPTMFASIQGDGYPILTLTGTLNGSPVTLGRGPSGGLSNLYFAPTLPVGWFAPLYLSTAAGTFTLAQTDVPHPGTGQSLVGPGVAAAVSFVVVPAPMLSSRAPAFIGNGTPVPFQRPVTAAAIAPRRAPIAIEVSVPAAIALAVGIYEWQHHRRHERPAAYYAGRD